MGGLGVFCTGLGSLGWYCSGLGAKWIVWDGKRVIWVKCGKVVVRDCFHRPLFQVKNF